MWYQCGVTARHLRNGLIICLYQAKMGISGPRSMKSGTQFCARNGYVRTENTGFELSAHKSKHSASLVQGCTLYRVVGPQVPPRHLGCRPGAAPQVPPRHPKLARPPSCAETRGDCYRDTLEVRSRCESPSHLAPPRHPRPAPQVPPRQPGAAPRVPRAAPGMPKLARGRKAGSRARHLRCRPGSRARHLRCRPGAGAAPGCRAAAAGAAPRVPPHHTLSPAPHRGRRFLHQAIRKKSGGARNDPHEIRAGVWRQIKPRAKTQVDDRTSRA